MTTVSVIIGAYNVSDAVKHVEVWRKATEGIDRCLIWIDNKNAVYSNLLGADASITITVDGADLFKGYVDEVKPKIEEKFLQTLSITGRGLGQDLQNKLYDYIYKSQPADDIIANILAQAGTEITFTSPGTAPSIYYDTKGGYVLDLLREILEYIDYDGFVKLTKEWDMFAIGTRDSGITLKSVLNATDNNIIQVLEHTEKDAWELKNYIIVFGTDKVDDGWTEGNASGWTVAPNNTGPFNYYGTSPYVIRKGVAAIYCGIGTGVFCDLRLVFPKYNHSSLDWSKLSNAELSIIICQYRGATDPVEDEATMQLDGKWYVQFPAIQLKDTAGNEICWRQPASVEGGGKAGWQLLNRPTVSGGEENIVAPIGTDVSVEKGTIVDYTTRGKWYQVYGSGFNWNVTRIRIWSISTQVEQLYIDGLTLPTQLIAVAQDGASQTQYKVRKLRLIEKDIATQAELQSYADSVLAKRKDPIKRLHLYARGDIGLIGGVWKWFAGYYVTVNVPAEGINNIIWRMIEIHHVISEEPVISGFDHVVELSLVGRYDKLETLRWSYGEKGQIAILRQLRDRIKAAEQEMIEVRDWYPALAKPIWEHYGRMPWDALNVNVPQDNMILNANFEVDYNGDSIPDCWKKVGDAVSWGYETGGIEGRRCVTVTINNTDKTNGRWETEDYYPIWAINTYVFRFVGKANNANAKLLLRINCYDENKTLIDYETFLWTPPDTGWNPYVISFCANDKGGNWVNTRYFKIGVGIRDATVATVKGFFDGVWMHKQVNNLLRLEDYLIDSLYFHASKFVLWGESLDGYDLSQTTGSGSVSVGAGYVRLQTGTTSLSNAYLLSLYESIKAERSPRLKAKIRKSENNVGDAQIRCISGSRHFGFKIWSNGNIYGTTGLASGQTTDLLLQSYAANTEYILEAYYNYAKGEVLFYVNDVYKGKITTTLPGSGGLKPIQAGIFNNNAVNCILEIFNYVVQEKWL